MGSELENIPTKKEDEITSFTDVFNEVFPTLMLVGMTYNQFWNDDVCLVKHYIKLYRLINDRREQDAWMIGIYVKEALQDVASCFGNKKYNYPDKPYGFFDNQIEESHIDMDMQKKLEEEKAKVWMMNLVQNN
ncbi:MAG: hypothetical protein HFF36_02590 [Coprobacillus sp.]|nr:hypothetical protein [Coprobacillus sp.]